MIILVLIIISASLGSFGNNIISGYINQKFDLKRSECLCGKKKLSIIELIPVLSFIYLKRRCKTCGIKIPWRYLIVELSFISVSLAAYCLYGLNLPFIVTCFTYYILIIIMFVDRAKLIIPNTLILMLSMLALFRQFIEFNILSMIISALITGSLVIYNSISFRRRGFDVIGWGDIKLLLVLLLIFKFPISIVALWFASFIALFSQGGKLFNKDRSKIPFGSYIAFSFISYS
jgi:prepilin signal peptidase PulO-like enzyme (type II secretory pathway)